MLDEVREGGIQGRPSPFAEPTLPQHATAGHDIQRQRPPRRPVTRVRLRAPGTRGHAVRRSWSECARYTVRRWPPPQDHDACYLYRDRARLSATYAHGRAAALTTHDPLPRRSRDSNRNLGLRDFPSASTPALHSSLSGRRDRSRPPSTRRPPHRSRTHSALIT